MYRTVGIQDFKNDPSLSDQEERHLEEQRERQKAGGGIACGPDGNYRFAPGGKKVRLGEPLKPSKPWALA